MIIKENQYSKAKELVAHLVENVLSTFLVGDIKDSFL